nr:hypothetical protein [Tanacetum cinerariifolium]
MVNMLMCTHIVKRIFRYLKGKPYLGLWYPNDSPFNLVAYPDSDYAGASLDKKSTTEGCQFLGCRLISWQCKKQTVVATYSTEAEYIAAASGYAQVLWMQNQLLDYGDMVMEIIVLNILSDALPITTNGQTAIGKESSNPFMAVNPPIYISCNKQFWNTAFVKRLNDVTRLQALVDKKKIVISEVVIREFLQLDDAEGIVCLQNEEIFAGLAQMGYEKPTSWNEFSTAMASAVIYLSKGQKFNFSKYIFDSLVRNVDSSSKFYMYPRIIQLIIQNQVGDLSTHSTRFISPTLTQKENVAEDVAHDVIPSPPYHDIPSPSQQPSSPPQQPQSSPQAPPQDAEFPPHIQQVLDVCSTLTRRVEHLENDKAAQQLEIIKLKARVKRLEKANMVKSSKLRHLKKVEASRRVESSDDIEDVFNQGRMIDDLDKDEGIELVKDADIAETEGRHAAEQAEKQAEIYHLDLDHSSKVLSMQEDDSKVQEVVEVVTTAKLITDVVTAASQVSAFSTTISAAKPSIPATAPTVVAAYTRRRKGVIIRDPEEELSLKTPAETPKVKDKGKGILIKTSKPIKKKDQIELDAEYARKLHKEINKDYEEINKDIDWDAAMDHTKSEARKNMMIYLMNTTGYKMNFFKRMAYAEICPIFQARLDENMRFLFKSREEMEEEDQEIIKSINETLAQKAAKRRKLNEEAQEAEDLRNRLEVVDDEDDDAFIKATLLLILMVETRYLLSRFTLEQLVNITRLQVEEESELSLELLRLKLKLFKNIDAAEDITKLVEENLHIRFSENTPNVVGTQSNNYPDPKSSHDDGFKHLSDDGKKVDEDPSKGNECYDQEKEDNVNSTNNVNDVSLIVNAVGTNNDNELPFDLNMPALEDVGTFDFSNEDEDDGEMADMNNLDTAIQFSHTLNFMVYQMDVKSAFLYGKIEEEVYVCQPPGFEDPDFPDRVYKIEKTISFLVQQGRSYAMHLKDNACEILDEFYERIYILLRITKVKNASTPMETQKPLLKDEDGEEVDVHMYRYQVNPKVSYIHAMKRIFRYLKGQQKLGLWYPKDSPFDLVAYTESDYAGASLDKKSTTGGYQFLRCRLISWHCKKQTVVANSTTEAEYVADSSCCGQVLWIQNQLLDYGKLKRKVTKVSQPSEPTEYVTDEAVYKELDDRLVRDATTASSLEAEQDSGNIDKNKSKATPNKASSLETTSDGGPRVLALEKTKSTQALKITSLKRRVKKVEKKQSSRTHKLKRLYKVGLTARVDSSEDDQSLGEEVFVEKELAGKEVNDAVQKVIEEVVEDINTAMLIVNDAQTSKPNTKGIVLQELSESTTTTRKTISSKKSQDKEFEEEQRLAREGAQKEQEANTALIEKWDDIQAKIDKRRKFFAAKVAEKRNKPPTQAQQRKIICTYLKNVKGKKLKYLKKNSFNSIQKMFDRAFKMVNTFVDLRIELIKVTTAGTRVKTASESYYCRYKEVTTAQVEVSAAQEFKEKY